MARPIEKRLAQTGCVSHPNHIFDHAGCRSNGFGNCGTDTYSGTHGDVIDLGTPVVLPIHLSNKRIRRTFFAHEPNRTSQQIATGL